MKLSSFVAGFYGLQCLLLPKNVRADPFRYTCIGGDPFRYMHMHMHMHMLHVHVHVHAHAHVHVYLILSALLTACAVPRGACASRWSRITSPSP